MTMAAELKTFLTGNASVLHPHRWHAAPLRQNPYAVNLDG